MMTLEIFSLIDITKTGVHKNSRTHLSSLTQEEWDFKRNQQRNWDTIIQLLSLRAQPSKISPPIKLTNKRPASCGFGWFYGSRNNVNIWTFTCEYDIELDLDAIRSEFSNIPIITNLEENIEINGSYLDSVGKNFNIIINKRQ